MRVIHTIPKLISFGTFLIISSCYQASSYKGDGKLVDNGWRCYSCRYVLDLGPIDLSNGGAYSYTLRNLPHAEFTIGIEIIELEPNRIDSQRPDHQGQVQLELKDANNEVIVFEDIPLDNWTWSYGEGDLKSFLYRSGETKEMPYSDGETRPMAVGKKPSDGWGSYFTAEESKAYSLKLQVLRPIKIKKAARLMLIGVVP